MTITVLLLAEAFLLGLSVISFKNNQLAFYTSEMRVYSASFSERVTLALRFGKSLDKFLGMDRLMQEVIEASGHIDNVEIFSIDNARLYAFDPDASETDIEAISAEMTEQPDFYRYRFVIHDGDDISGTGIFSIQEERINQAVADAIKSGLKPIGYSIIAVLLILVPALQFFLSDDYQRIPKKRIITIVFLSIVFCQAFYTYFSVNGQVGTYRNMAFEVVDDATKIHLDDINYLVGKGFTLPELYGMDQRIRHSVESLPELAFIEISDGKKLIYQWGDTSNEEDLQHNLINGGTIIAGLNQEYISHKVKELVLDSLTVMGLSLIFITELTIFLLIYINIHSADTITDKKQFTLGYIRPAIAIYLFGTMLGISFIPVFMDELTAGRTYLGLSSNVLNSTPVSIEILAALIASFIAGGWMDRSGWYKPFLFGIGLSIVAALLSSMATHPITFVLYRGLAGLGYGLSWMSAQGFLFHFSDGKQLGRSSASLIAGIYSGYICGGAVGGLIADRLGYAAVFQFSGIILILPALFVILFMSSFFIQPDGQDRETDARATLDKAKKYLTSKSILSILLFSLFPFSLAQMGLFLYATPVILDALEVSKATTGRVMMIYGITVIYLGPYLGSLTDKVQNKRLFIILAGISGTLGLCLVEYMHGVLALSIALFFISIAGSIGNPAISVLVHAQPVTGEVGMGFAVGIQRVFDKFGQMLGPLVLGVLFSFYSFEISIQILGVFYGLATLCFALVNRRQV